MNGTWGLDHSTEITSGVSYPEGLVKLLKTEDVLILSTPGFERRGVLRPLQNALLKNGIKFSTLATSTANPSFNDLREIIQKISHSKPKKILAIGGGSTIDLAKIISYVLTPESGGVEVLLKILVDNGSLYDGPVIPVIACPTTAGTGSEVTPFATLWDMDEKKKYSVATSHIFPAQAVLIPELTTTLPWDITLSTGLDAFSQCLESVWNKNYSGTTLSLAIRGVELAWHALPVLKINPTDLAARAQMLEASLLSGLCISKTRTAMAHAISYPLTAHFGTPHGIACSFTLPELWKFNLSAATDDRFELLSRALKSEPTNFAQDLKNWMSKLAFSEEFRKTITEPQKVLDLQSEMFNPARAGNNLRPLGHSELSAIIANSLKYWI